MRLKPSAFENQSSARARMPVSHASLGVVVLTNAVIAAASFVAACCNIWQE
eukprot:m.287088 g.287088  ORF g.287088 m.287088 type:complete len:51 (-) comp55010_c0_seq1:1189-1341(-)